MRLLTVSYSSTTALTYKAYEFTGSPRGVDLEGRVNLLHQAENIAAVSFDSVSPGSNWSTATPSTMKPAGLDFGRTDGQLSLMDPFLNNADKGLGPRRPWEMNDGALVMMEPKDNNKRAASRPPNNDGGSPDAKRQRSLTEAEIDELFGGPAGGVPIDGHSESASMAESVEEVMNALI